MTKRKRKKTSTSKIRSAALLNTLKSERLHFILGVIVAFFGIFMLLAIISFFFTGASDQSKVLNATFRELISSKTLEVEKWTGAGGAFIAERLVNDWCGVFSALIPLFFVYLGLRLMRVSDFHFLKALFITAFGIICGSITSAFILDNLFPNTHIRWGGAHGIQVEGVLQSSVGWPGIVLLIILFIIITVVTVRRSSMYKIQKSLVENKPNFNRYDDATEPQDAVNYNQDAKEPGLIKRFLLKIKKNLSVTNNISDTDIIETEKTQPEAKVEPASVKPLSTPVSKPTATKISGEGDDDFEIIIPVEDEKVDSLN